MSAFDPITLRILWSRLISIADEAAATLVRTSFSTVVRESNDFACTLLDARGGLLAQSAESIPSFLGTIPRTVRHFLARYPADELRPGDVLITNDPWLATGHLPDITIATPVFLDGALIAFACATAHSPDIGGRLRSPDAREVYEEGLRIPPLHLCREGRPVPEVVELIRANVRVPEQTLGDIWAEVAANDLAARRLCGLCREADLTNLVDLAAEIQSAAENAIRRAIADVPDGTYRSSLLVDGFDEPLRLALTISVRGDTIDCDYAGTSAQISHGLNTVLNYTYAYTAYPLKCILDPETPNNEGCWRPITVRAPEGSLLNPRPPAAVGGRALVGHYLHALVFEALDAALPGRVPAPSGSPLWGVTLAGRDPRRGTPFTLVCFWNGGYGAGPDRDGISCLSFPSNIACTPVEMIEQAPVRVLLRTLIPDSGGPGRWRGGLGQRVVLQVTAPEPVVATFLADRTRCGARGLRSGGEGSRGRVLLNGSPINPKVQHVLAPGDVLTLDLPGGGGYGPARERPAWLVREDLLAGRISAAAARTLYGLEG